MPSIAYLPQRGVLAVSGADRVGFLNGLVSNDIAKAAPGEAVWAASLTAQGRYLLDFFAYAADEVLLLEMPRAAVAGFAARLQRYRLRAKVEITDVSAHYFVYAVWGGMPPFVPVTARDPRLAQAGYRCLSEAQLAANASEADYALHRLGLGLPDGPPDLEPEKTLLLEAGFDELNGVAWDKGCYVGQELTARTKYRGLVKRRLVPVVLSELAAPGTKIFAEGVEVGELRSSSGILGLASLRLDALKKPLLGGNAVITPKLQPWMRLPE